MIVLDWFLGYFYDNLVLFICLYLDNKICYLLDKEIVLGDYLVWVNKYRFVCWFWKDWSLKKIVDKNGDFCCLFWYFFDDVIFKNSVDLMMLFDCILKVWVFKELYVFNDFNIFIW